MKKLILAFLTLFICFACNQRTDTSVKNETIAPPDPIVGVWKITEYSFNSIDTSWTNNSPQPSLFIFCKDYYSIMYVSGNEPRPLMPEDATRSTLTDEQIQSNFMTFIANSGKYEMDESKFTVHPIVALEPNYMNGGSSEYEYKIESETLYLTRTVTSGVQQYKLVRLSIN